MYLLLQVIIIAVTFIIQIKYIKFIILNHCKYLESFEVNALTLSSFAIGEIYSERVIQS